MLHQVQSNCRHKCCAQVLRSCANMSCLPFCAHYHETRTKRTSHVCAHRTLQRVPLNTRYTFKQSSMFNGVGINCSYLQRVPLNTRCTFKQSSMLNGVGINCSHVAMYTCKQQKSRDRTRRTSHICAHRTLQRVPLNTRYTLKQLSDSW